MNFGIETETLEFKKSTGELKEAMYSICAMLNKHGHGELYFGIKQDGTPIGQVISESTLREVSRSIGSHIEPRIYPEVSKVVLDGKECVRVKFSGDQAPYFAYGVARIRVADEDVTLSANEITSLLLKNGREGNRWENLVSDKTIEDVDEELLIKYTRQAHDAGRIPIEYTNKETVLNQLELTDNSKLLNAGKALFSDDLLQDVQLAIFATDKRQTFHDIQRHHGPVLKLVDIAENYIRSNIHWRVKFTGELERTEIPEIPMDAVREALLNSFCHKDFASGESNEVAIYADRVEIYNPGAFPLGLDPIDFIENIERPVRRNPKIARILYFSKEIESFGTGLKRIADSCNAADVRYEFRKLKTGFVVCFYRELDTSGKKPIEDEKKPIMSEKKPIGDEKKPIESEKKPIGNGRDLIKISREEQIEKFIRENGSISNREARELLCLADSTVKRILKGMVDRGILRPDGDNRHRRYYLP